MQTYVKNVKDEGSNRMVLKADLMSNMSFAPFPVMN